MDFKHYYNPFHVCAELELVGNVIKKYQNTNNFIWSEERVTLNYNETSISATNCWSQIEGRVYFSSEIVNGKIIVSALKEPMQLPREDDFFEESRRKYSLQLAVFVDKWTSNIVDQKNSGGYPIRAEILDFPVEFRRKTSMKIPLGTVPKSCDMRSIFKYIGYLL